jgi:predicted Zn-dependent protease
VTKRIFSRLSALTILVALLAPMPLSAQGLRLIRDAEIESTIRIYATPLFQAAGVSPQSVRLFLVNDDALNAFVTSGNRMFINTGLLVKAINPMEVIGVMAHETGHMAGGHVAIRGKSLENAQSTIIASYLLGIGAALATGRGEAASAIISGGQDIALKGYLGYNRGQESAADQAGIRLLEATKQSPQGLLDFMGVLRGQEVLLASSQDPYLRTHPLTQERISFLENAVAQSPFRDTPPSEELVRLHKRVRAKLIGFLWPIARVFQTYREDDNSLESRYARAIAHYREVELDMALPLIDSLIAEYPDDPYFYELKGQMLYENARGLEALPAFEKAAALLPESPQLHFALAQAQIEANSSDLDKQALDNLSFTLRHEPNNSAAWRLSAIAYGRSGDTGMTALSLAEAALARGQARESLQHAHRAVKLLPAGSPSSLRAQDIEGLAQRLVDRN